MPCTYRNGTIKSITDIIHNLNNAKLDEKTGTVPLSIVSISRVAYPLALAAHFFIHLRVPFDIGLFIEIPTDHPPFDIEVVIAPPSLYLLLAREHLRKGIEVAAQNVFDKPNGAFTGEISAEQLKDSGIGWTLVGHSERRVILGEDDGVSL